MALIYKVINEESTKYTASSRVCTKCKISAKNIIAFCVYNDVETFPHEINNAVFVTDLVTPWRKYKVCSTKNKITVLEWNDRGDQLLLGYIDGIVEIWVMDANTLNLWRLSCVGQFTTEAIANAIYFQNGRQWFFNAQKKELSSYVEKFELLEHYQPTMLNGTVNAVEGCIVLTTTGTLGAFMLPRHMVASEMLSSLQITTHILNLCRNFVVCSSISHSANGHVNIALKARGNEANISCYRVYLKKGLNDSIQIQSDPLSSIFLSMPGKRKIAHIKWTSIKNDDVIFVAYDCDEGARLEQWSFVKKFQTVHHALQKTKGDIMRSHDDGCWQLAGWQLLPGVINELCLSKLMNEQLQIFAVLDNDTVHVLEPGLKGGFKLFERSYEDRRTTPRNRFVAADVTPLTQILLVLDKYNQMWALQTPAPNVYKYFKSIYLQVSLLEYSILTGIDASDLLLLNIANMDMLIEKLTENFTRQSVLLKQYLYSNFLALKSNMCRIQTRERDFDELVFLHLVSITFKSLLRPADLASPDKGPADDLSLIIADSLPDVDKVVSNLVAKDFTVEPSMLQSMQPLIQWVADLALNILHRVAHGYNKSNKLNKRQGYDISKDSAAIASIRELLVIIRTWGLLNSHCLPVYPVSVETVDVVSVLFRLLTRLAQNTAEPDEMLMDECSTLTTQLRLPNIPPVYPPILLHYHLAQMKALPMIIKENLVPPLLQDLQMKSIVFTSSAKDNVANMHLGVKTGALRRCIRCGLVNHLQKLSKNSAMRSWSNRFEYCFCGGFWLLSKDD